MCFRHAVCNTNAVNIRQQYLADKTYVTFSFGRLVHTRHTTEL